MDKNAEKERLLKEIKYFTNRIEDCRKETKSKLYLESSDSEDDLPTFRAPGPSISELRTTESGLQTSLQATQELTSLTVLQYETNVMVEPPKIKRGRPITEPGIWREVTAECRIDAIPFSITFCTHQGNKKFAPILYRNLTVLPVKKVHEVELGQSVLPDVTRPSDAFEILKSYAIAFRSRRTSLARLANKYSSIQLEPAAEGGYLLKCGSVLAITWRLENKWTPLTPFHHKMKFDLDYMEEDQLKIIKQAHKKISDPTINTDERTLLLAKIISTCLEVKATQDESMESEAESIKRTERTIIEDNPDDNLVIEHEYHNNLSKNDGNNEEDMNIEGDRDVRGVNDENEREKEIMAPPKSLPKKAKPKGKENKIDNRKAVKRTADEAVEVTKKAKVAENNVANKNSEQTTNDKEITKDQNSKDQQNKQKSVENQVNNAKISNKTAKNDDNMTQNQNGEAKNYKTHSNVAGNSKQNINKQVKNKISVQNEGSQPKKAKVDKNQVTEKNVNKNQVQKTNIVDKINENNKQNEVIQAKNTKISEKEATKQTKELNKQKNKQTITKESTTNAQTDKTKQIVSKNVAKSLDKVKNQVKTSTGSEKPTKSTTDIIKTTKTGPEKSTKPTTVTEKTTKSNPNTAKNSENLPKTDPKNTKVIKNPSAGQSTSKSTENLSKNSNKQINIEKNIQNFKNSEQNKVSNIPKTNSNPKTIEKVQKSVANDLKKPTVNKTSYVAITKTVDKPKLAIKSQSNLSKIKKPGNIVAKNLKGLVSNSNISKIPQKKNSASSTSDFMWVSPRNQPSTSDTNSLRKMPKTNTNIPRLMKKPVPKVK